MYDDVDRILELLAVHVSCCACSEDAHARLVRDVIVGLGVHPITFVIDSPRRVALVTVPETWTVYDLLRLFGDVTMVATRQVIGGVPLPIDKSLSALLISDDEVIFLRSPFVPSS